jgi:hypothetical protein
VRANAVIEPPDLIFPRIAPMLADGSSSSASIREIRGETFARINRRGYTPSQETRTNTRPSRLQLFASFVCFVVPPSASSSAMLIATLILALLVAVVATDTSGQN